MTKHLRHVAALVLLIGFTPARAQTVPEPNSYRQDAYQASVPTTLRGVPALTTANAKLLWTQGAAIFIDVLPHAPKPAGLPEGTIWNEKPHSSIRGAIWLPEVGRGALAPETENYYQRHLAALTAGDRNRPLVIFCRRDCWMSWNAARRAQSYGYTQVMWYAEGADGWAEAALPVEAVEPQS